MLTIDGLHGEGGGQILRTALALSLVTGRPFRITRIRAGRSKPGLLRQHLTAVEAAAAVGRAEVEGIWLGSPELTFVPAGIEPGEHRFAVGTAGSATLVLQTVLPALLRADRPSRLTLSGGTHNTHAPPFDFLANTFAPILNRMGPRLEAQLIRPGFYPAGGGEMVATITPARTRQRLELLERGELRQRRARALVARLPLEIARRELREVRRRLQWPEAELHAEEVHDAHGPGNVLMLELEYDQITEVITAFGARGVSAEAVARAAVEQATQYLNSDAPVGEHLADQLLLPLVLAGSGAFRTVCLSSHATTNIDVIRRFVDITIEARAEPNGAWRLTVSP